MMSEFSLHPQLESDTLLIGDLALCRMLLMNNASFPWVISVPKIPDLIEITDLNEANRQILMQEICGISHAMKAHFNADKMNIATLGNMVSQLHIHIIVRYKNDMSWPNPVWGMAAKGYENATDTVQTFKKLLGFGV